jgi:nucleoside 2-deoxyribosyltransferase
VWDCVNLACERLREQYEDLTWERADQMTDAGRITDQIISAIERADLVIADVTESNPNVMFELGYAAALGRPIILLNQAVDESPFDIKDWRQIVYSVDKLAEARGELVRHLDANLHRVRERRG